MSRMGSSKLGGVALVIGSILLLSGHILQIDWPRGPYELKGGEVAWAQFITDNIGMWYISNTMITLGLPICVLGFLTLFGILAGRDEEVYFISAIISIGFGVALQTVSLLSHSFIEPVLARDYLGFLSTQAGWAALEIFRYSSHLEGVLQSVSILALTLGLSLLGASLVKTRLYNKWFAWAGVVIFGFYFLGYIISKVLLYYGHDVTFDLFLLFGWVYVLLYYVLHVTAATYIKYILEDIGVIIAIWLLVLGIFKYRGR